MVTAAAAAWYCFIAGVAHSYHLQLTQLVLMLCKANFELPFATIHSQASFAARVVVQVTVILEHMFHPSEMEEEATLREDLEDDIKTECTKMGPVEKVA